MNVRRFGFLAFVLFALGAWWWLTNGGLEFRRPAAAQVFPHVDYEIQDTGDDLLIRSMKIRLLQGFAWVESGDGNWDLKMSSFVLVNREGHRRGACELYSQIRLTVIASGVLISGDSPRLVVTLPCQERSGELVLPRFDFRQIQELVKTKATWEDDSARFEAIWLDEEWYRDWELSRIELAPMPSVSAFEIDSYEIQAVRPGASAISTQ